MKKVLLSAIAIFAFGFSNAQSHQAGTMQVNVVGGFLTGTTTSKDDAAGSVKSKYTTTGAQFGANFQYGVAESFSVGLGLEIGTSVLTPKSVNYYGYDYSYDYGYSNNPSLSTFKVIASARYYFLNKDKFNVYAGPSVGYTTGKDKTVYGFDYGTDKTKFNGLNYGVNVGGNYFFTDIVGVTLNLGYEGNSLKSKLNSTDSDTGLPTTDTGKVTLGGVKVMAGLALKF